MTQPAEPEPTDFAALYRVLTNGTQQLLSYHSAEGRITTF